MTPVLQVVHRAITRFLLDQAGLKAEQAGSGAVTLIFSAVDGFFDPASKLCRWLARRLADLP